MADTPEMFELLNFYYGIIKNWKEMGCEEVVSIMNAGFAEELPPVHKCAQLMLESEVKFTTKEELKVNKREYEVLRKNSVIEMMINSERVAGKKSSKSSSYKITKGFKLPPGLESSQIVLNNDKDECAPKKIRTLLPLN
eukprot:TRINITY_DN9410_c0_g2_i2.p4 TRINITY_DN9410_c0_g2~~TRINITY_DN9410_c0_g2_i2.p4  ORF type:complete len:139 (-),score=36.11 TRINITY_DN9410_c0_g2_i2:86-502(-)